MLRRVLNVVRLVAKIARLAWRKRKGKIGVAFVYWRKDEEDKDD